MLYYFGQILESVGIVLIVAGIVGAERIVSSKAQLVEFVDKNKTAFRFILFFSFIIFGTSCLISGWASYVASPVLHHLFTALYWAGLIVFLVAMIFWDLEWLLDIANWPYQLSDQKNYRALFRGIMILAGLALMFIGSYIVDKS